MASSYYIWGRFGGFKSVMIPSKGFWDWQLLANSVILGGAIAFSGSPTKAQIVPDATLGAESSVITPHASGSTVDVIQGGATRGANLFHSFERFSVTTESAGYFNNALNIQNIISRVTGTSISNIDGLIQANGAANLFLINANGIIFGPNASLDIGGSFVGSTASAVNFADGNQFSATAPQTTPLLTMSVPIGLQLGGTAGGIQVQGSGLQIQTGQTLALMGGNVSVEGGEFGLLEALGGRIELGGLAGVGMVDIEGLQSEGAFRLMSLRFPDAVERADVSLTNYAFVDVAAGGGGSIVINARNLEMLGGDFGGSVLRAGIESGLGSPEATAGDITLNATGAINVANSSTIVNDVNTGAVGKGGNIDIQARSLSLTDGASLGTGTSGQGDAGSVLIQARDVSFVNSYIFNLNTGNLLDPDGEVAVGKAGDIIIQTGWLFVSGDNSIASAGLSTSTSGRGDAGSVFIRASGPVSFTSGSGISSSVQETGVGRGGDINILADSLFLDDALLFSNTWGHGNAGSISVQTNDSVSLANSSISSDVSRGAVGKGGNVDIQTRSLSLTDDASLSTGTSGQGDAGSVLIQARDVSFVNSSIFNQNNGDFDADGEGAVGKAGDIIIQTGSLFVSGDNASLDTFTYGQGNAGSVLIRATGPVSFTNRSVILSSVAPSAIGKGGDINIITTGLLSVTDGARLDTRSDGSGVAGNIEVVADSIRLDNQAILSSETTAGQGNIILRSEDLVLRRGSSITTNATGTATGGNININTGVLAALENSDITANAEEASGGQVMINAQGIFGTEFRNRLTSESDITATSTLGSQFSGTVEINTSNVDLNQGLVTLPVELVNVEGLIANSCIARSRQQRGNFNITGAGGLPIRPGDAAISPYPTGTVRSIPNNDASPSSSQISPVPSINKAHQWKMGDPIVEPQGVYRLANGELVLSRECSH